MLRDDFQIQWRGCVPVAALLAIAVLTPGCSSGGGSLGSPATVTSDASASPPPASPSSPPASPSLKDKIANFFSGATQKGAQPVPNGQQADVDCPYIDIRQGASTLTIPPPPPDGSGEAMALKYQGTFVRAARDCAIVNGQMVMRIGVQGRIIVGPAGGPGQVDVPLRFAVVSDPTKGSSTVTTRLVRIPVTIGPGDGNATFTHIEEGLSFPLPPSGLANYVVYIGFDPIGAAAQDRAVSKPAPKLKPKSKPNPNAPTG
jgi:hypothetical protein